MSKQMESVYRQAAAILRKQGWVKESLGVRDGPCCMEGAVSLARTHGVSVRAGVGDSNTLLDVCDTFAIYTFNDYFCETVDDAIAALEIAADIEACS